MGITNTKFKRWLSLGGKVEHNRRPQCIGNILFIKLNSGYIYICYTSLQSLFHILNISY